MQDGGVPVAFGFLDKHVATSGIAKRDVEMHAGACVFFDRFGHEAGGHAMLAGLQPNDPLQPHQIIGGLHHIGAVMQGQFILARCIFRNHGFRLDPGLVGSGVDVAEQRQHPVQVIDGIHLGLVRAAAIQHVAGGLHLAIRATVIGQQEEFKLERAGGEKPILCHCIDLPLQGVTRVRCHGIAIQIVKRHQHLAARRLGGVQRHQRAGDRPGAQVAIALIPDQAGFMHILATDIQTEDGNRQMTPAVVK